MAHLPLAHATSHPHLEEDSPPPKITDREIRLDDYRKNNSGSSGTKPESKGCNGVVDNIDQQLLCQNPSDNPKNHDSKNSQNLVVQSDHQTPHNIMMDLMKYYPKGEHLTDEDSESSAKIIKSLAILRLMKLLFL
jgi:hypothetical protein